MGSTAIALDHVQPPYLQALRSEAIRRGLTVVAAPEEGSVEAGPVALAILQLDGADTHGIERVRRVRRLLDEPPFVVLGGRLDAESVFRLSRLGISAVVNLPGTPDDVATRCLSHIDPDAAGVATGLVGSSPAMDELRRTVRRVAQTRCNVLVTGETGTGKGLVARTIHAESSASDDRFIHVDCGSLSPTLIESELFGHERGAFTGAMAPRTGRFELAGEGIIFLDEIGELDLALQSKLLRVLDERAFERVGSSRTLRMRARVIAATSRNLDAELEAGRFRAELYYRLKVVHLHVPPLRERITDVPRLVGSGVAMLSRRLGVAEAELSDAAIERLMQYSWPGNVRELMNVLEALLVGRAGMRIETRDLEGVLGGQLDLPGMRPSGPAPMPLAEAITETGERARLIEQLEATGGNVARMARRMGIPRSTLRYRIRRQGLSDRIPRD